MANTIITETPAAALTTKRADFRKELFDAILFQKGYDILHERAIACACKSPSTNQQSNCMNCGGSGWFFINPTKTRAILTAMNRATKYKEWSAELIGRVNITTQHELRMTEWDRITVLDGESVFTQVIHIKKAENDVLFSFIDYIVKEFLYVGLFESVTSAYSRLIKDVDYTFDENKFFLNDKYMALYNTKTEDNPISISLRYIHPPQYHIEDMNREIMSSWENKTGTEERLNLPIHGVARRAHYILAMNNIAKNNIIDNSFDENENTKC